MRLILFDIDGTLLECGPQVRPILTEILGPPAPDDYSPPPTGDPSAASPPTAR